ncbi:MAG: MFS transporter [Chloroflexota bacterium]|nr:MFS transporter [Chloroflexota bacterium]
MDRLAPITLALLFGANCVNFMDRQVVAALAPLLKGYWHLSDAQVGLLGSAFEALYALGHVPLALLADRWLRGRVIALTMVLWSGAMALTGGAGSYGMLLLGRAALGLGEAGYGPSALAWLGDIFPPDRRSRVVGFHDLGVMLGSAAGYALGGVIGSAWGWRYVFTIAALPGFILAILIWYLPEPRKGESDYHALGIDPHEVSVSRPRGNETIRRLFSVPTLLVTYAAGTLNTFAVAGMIYWLPSFAVRLHGFREDAFGLITGGLTVVAGAAGVLSGAFLADHLLLRTPAGRLLTMSIGTLIGGPVALAAVLVPGRVPFVILGGLAMYAFTFSIPCVGPLIHQVTRPRLRATAMAIYLLVVHILGNATAPTVVGWLSDRSGDLRLGIVVAPLAALLSGLLGLWGTRFVAQDGKKMRARLRAEAVG